VILADEKQSMPKKHNENESFIDVGLSLLVFIIQQYAVSAPYGIVCRNQRFGCSVASIFIATKWWTDFRNMWQTCSRRCLTTTVDSSKLYKFL